MKKTIVCLIALAYFISNIFSQDRTITGKVIDFKGMPVAGVNVMAKDYPSLVTITGAEGQFQLPVYNFTKALQFNFAGMRPKEVPLTELNQLLVVMDYLPGKNPYPWNIVVYPFLYRADVVTPVKNNDTAWNCSGAPGASISIEIEYFITKRLGISTGLGFNTYNAKAWLKNYNNYGVNKILRTDVDNETYYLYNSVNYLEEKTKVRTMSIPLKLKYRLNPGKKWDFFIDAGLKMMFTMDAKVQANGACQWQGYYPQYHVVLYDLAQYGFVNYQIDTTANIPNHSKFTVSVIGDIGISHQIGKKAYFDIGFFYEQGLSDLNYRKPAYQGDYLNTLGTPDKTFVKGLGLLIGFRYNFIKRKK